MMRPSRPFAANPHPVRSTLIHLMHRATALPEPSRSAQRMEAGASNSLGFAWIHTENRPSESLPFLLATHVPLCGQFLPDFILSSLIIGPSRSTTAVPLLARSTPIWLDSLGLRLLPLCSWRCRDDSRALSRGAFTEIRILYSHVIDSLPSPEETENTRTPSPSSLRPMCSRDCGTANPSCFPHSQSHPQPPSRPSLIRCDLPGFTQCIARQCSLNRRGALTA
jgi:hypothetical protein